MYIPTLPSVRPAPPLIARGGWKSYVDRSKLAGGNGTGPLLSAVQLGRQSVQASLDALRPEPDAIASALQKLAGVPESIAKLKANDQWATAKEQSDADAGVALLRRSQAALKAGDATVAWDALNKTANAFTTLFSHLDPWAIGVGSAS